MPGSAENYYRASSPCKSQVYCVLRFYFYRVRHPVPVVLTGSLFLPPLPKGVLPFLLVRFCAVHVGVLCFTLCSIVQSLWVSPSFCSLLNLAFSHNHSPQTALFQPFLLYFVEKQVSVRCLLPTTLNSPVYSIEGGDSVVKALLTVFD